jgi:sugar transferase EpsL
MNANTIFRSSYRRWGKRLVDISVSVIALLILWPLLALVYLILRFSTGAPVIFRQTRPGYLGKPFTIYKFRTMTEERDESGRPLPDKDRVTRIGTLIRGLSIDELPELLNVLKGDMSLVGPRPLMQRYMNRYSPEQARRHQVIPGITGWSQVNGRNDLPWEEKLSLDVWYVDHQNLRLDFCILWLTIWKVLRREGISRKGFVTSPEFMGTQHDGGTEVIKLVPESDKGLIGARRMES